MPLRSVRRDVWLNCQWDLAPRLALYQIISHQNVSLPPRTVCSRYVAICSSRRADHAAA